ncbi:hypothetical protein ANPL_03360 [Anaplasma platys]|uniref:Uncharacterized protein n=1 Tax=Anaplasma platys TaxID=949 RepID=A0A858PYT6_9RICK|nr:hypothetical protein ANPL_03360 [Anaplasma platys]
MNPIIMYAAIGLLVGVVLEVLISLGMLLVATFVCIRTKIQNLLQSMCNKKSERQIMNNPDYSEGTTRCQQSANRESQSKNTYSNKVLLGVLVACMLAAIIAQVVTGDFAFAATVAILSMAPILVFTCLSYLINVTSKSEATLGSPRNSRTASAYTERQAGPTICYPVQLTDRQHRQNACASQCYAPSSPSAPPQDYTQNATYIPATYHRHTTDPYYSQHISSPAYLQSHLTPSCGNIHVSGSGESNIQHRNSLCSTLPASTMAGTHVEEATVHYHSSGSCEHFR